ncbi:hypothetical protein ACERJO_20245 [Halalkalibacter sp. AB-rgal2]|uniref:hypothetical protein n=1 Tax=Halalkalibacter sp. AB-rgal2 TaxID=3242695 RepID=UPI00359CCE4A
MIIVLALFTVVLNTACSSNESSLNLEEQLDGTAIDTISVYSPTAKVFLEKSMDDHIHVTLSGTFTGSDEEKDELISTFVNGSELEVVVENAGSRLWKVNSVQLDIQVPALKKSIRCCLQLLSESITLYQAFSTVIRKNS